MYPRYIYTDDKQYVMCNDLNFLSIEEFMNLSREEKVRQCRFKMKRTNFKRTYYSPIYISTDKPITLENGNQLMSDGSGYIREGGTGSMNFYQHTFPINNGEPILLAAKTFIIRRKMPEK